MTNITDTTAAGERQEDLEETGAANPAAAQTQSDPEEPVAVTPTPTRHLTLTDYLNEQVPAKLRAATYATIVAAVMNGELKGIVHDTQKGQMTVTLSNGKEVTRPYAHVLLKNTVDL
jgi:hypothetical protein